MSNNSKSLSNNQKLTENLIMGIIFGILHVLAVFLCFYIAVKIGDNAFNFFKSYVVINSIIGMALKAVQIVSVFLIIGLFSMSPLMDKRNLTYIIYEITLMLVAVIVSYFLANPDSSSMYWVFLLPIVGIIIRDMLIVGDFLKVKKKGNTSAIEIIKSNIYCSLFVFVSFLLICIFLAVTDSFNRWGSELAFIPLAIVIFWFFIILHIEIEK